MAAEEATRSSAFEEIPQDIPSISLMVFESIPTRLQTPKHFSPMQAQAVWAPLRLPVDLKVLSMGLMELVVLFPWNPNEAKVSLASSYPANSVVFPHFANGWAAKEKLINWLTLFRMNGKIQPIIAPIMISGAIDMPCASIRISAKISACV